MVEIKVLEIKKMDNTGSLKGFAEITIGETIFRDFRIIQQDGQKPWISAPCQSWQNDEGKTCYMPLVVFPQRLKEQVENEILREYEKRWGDRAPEIKQEENSKDTPF